MDMPAPQMSMLFSCLQTRFPTGNLLSMQAGAAATLTGLVFVAVSINLTKIVATH